MNKSKIKWPMTPAAQAREMQQRLQSASSLAEVGEAVKAASGVKMPVTARVQAGLHEAANQHKTGKSNRRAMKRNKREAQESMTWEELNNVAVNCASMLAVSSRMVPMLNHQELLSHVADKKLLNRLVLSVVTDTRVLASDFQKIQALHTGKSGQIDVQDMTTAVGAFSDYVNFTELTNACLIPTLTHVSEVLSEALNKLFATNPEAANQLNMDVINFDLRKMRAKAEEVTGAAPAIDPSASAAQAEAPAIQVA